MKKYFLLSQILLLSIYSKSQQPPSKLSVDASVGLSLPVGKFGDKSAFQFANNSAKVPGWANAGPALQLNINYQIQELYGISFLIGGQKNGQDKEALENQARQFNAPNGKFELTTNSWEIFRLMAGGYLKIPLRANKLYFQPKILGGILKTSIPAYNFLDTTYSTGSNAGSLTKTSLPWSFCYQIGTELQYRFSKKIFFLAGIDFLHSSPTGFTIESAPPYNTPEHFNQQYLISSFNLMVGIRFSAENN